MIFFIAVVVLSDYWINEYGSREKIDHHTVHSKTVKMVNPTTLQSETQPSSQPAPQVPPTHNVIYFEEPSIKSTGWMVNNANDRLVFTPAQLVKSTTIGDPDGDCIFCTSGDPSKTLGCLSETPCYIVPGFSLTDDVLIPNLPPVEDLEEWDFHIKYCMSDHYDVRVMYHTKDGNDVADKVIHTYTTDELIEVITELVEGGIEIGNNYGHAEIQP